MIRNMSLVRQNSKTKTSMAKTETEVNWINEVFKPKYCIDDFLSSDFSDKKLGIGLPCDFYSKIYSSVVADELIAYKTKEDLKAKESTLQTQESPPKKEVKFPNPGTTNWSYHNDWKTLRDSYNKLQRRAEMLLQILELKNERISELKKENKIYKQELILSKQLISKLNKDKARSLALSETYKNISNSLEKKLQFYEHSNVCLAEKIYSTQQQLRLLETEYNCQKILT